MLKLLVTCDEEVLRLFKILDYLEYRWASRNSLLCFPLSVFTNQLYHNYFGDVEDKYIIYIDEFSCTITWDSIKNERSNSITDILEIKNLSDEAIELLIRLN